jgi:glycosyltransferase involved in cell wall biosynthesis
VRRAGSKIPIVLVPTAEDDPAIRLRVFESAFAAADGVLYLTPEERALVESAFPVVANKPRTIVGSGLDLVVPDRKERESFGLGPYALYAGRIDRNKGVDVLFRYYDWLKETWPECPTLVLVGHPVLEIPTNPRIRYLGYVTPAQKAALIEGATVVLMPSPYESLSIIALEAWSLARPVLASARCAVLVGQCERSGGGLYYRDFAEFERMLRRLFADPPLATALGASGQRYVLANYSWDRAKDAAERVLFGRTAA